MTTENSSGQLLVAANRNPGGSTTTKVVLTSIVELMARAYVAELKEKEQMK